MTYSVLVYAKSLQSCLTLTTPWTVAHQILLSVEFSRHECWSRLPSPPPGDLSEPGWSPSLLCPLQWQVGSLPLAPLGNCFGSSCIQRKDSVFVSVVQ